MSSPPDLHALAAYDYELPPELIAQRAVEPRDSSRLLVVDRSRGRWEHRKFTDLAEYLDAGDVLVANNTRVIKARLLGQRLVDQGGAVVKGGKVEFLLLEPLPGQPRVWEGMFHASAKHRPGVRFEIPTPDGLGLRGTLIRGASDSPHGTVIAEFEREPLGSGAGVMPLPPYIERAGETADETRYQTLYAKEAGSAAAPTAGLHFTDSLLARLRERGVGWEEVTLHVGLGTFRPVKEPDVRRHVMHEERYEVSALAAARINAAKGAGRRLVAVGTTAVRTLESAWSPGEGLRAGEGRTALFIRPGEYEFRAVDRLLTNFHLPRSTLLMLVAAFAGRELTLAAYAEAVREKYRFFSYGDAMLIR